MPVETLNHIPEERLELVKREFENAGATEIKSESDGEGTFKVVATFPDGNNGD